MTFTVYGPQHALTEALVESFKKIAQTGYAQSVDELQAQNAANIIVISPFHSKLPPHFGKKILSVVITNHSSDILNNGSYYVFGRANPSEAAQVVVKRFLGFESSRSCVICPDTEVPHTALPIFPVSEAEVAVPKISAPVETKALSQPVPVRNEVAKEPKQKRSFKVRIKIPKRKTKNIAVLTAILLVWLLSLPFALILLSGGCAYGAMHSFSNKRSIATVPLLHCARLSSEASSFLTRLSPLKSSSSLSQFMSNASVIALEANSIYKSIPVVSIDTLTAVSPQLSQLARDVAVLSSHTTEISQVSSFSRQLPLFLRHASLFQVLAATSSQASDLLGKTSPKTYLVLLQNNMELRPTGGFIGSFLLVDVDNGEVTSQQIYDVYDADGQLTGYVKPPEAIVNYLGEASWHLRDSNWDPDFEISAKRAAWFLDKSLNRQVDGVIGVDLEVLRTLIKSVGPLTVPDYDDTLTADNFYATIQTQVHKEFFPGSRKKSNYLTAVFHAALTKLNEAGSGTSLSLLSGIIQNLDSRDIQFYSTNELMQNEFNKAGIAGAVSVNSLGFVEANVGVNKSNQYIERLGGWKFEKGESGETRVTGALQLTNTAQVATDETRYRVYIRSFAPKGSILQSLQVSVGGVKQAVVPEKESVPTREQDGAFFEVTAGQKVVITVTWTCPTSTDISLWKQGGVLPYPISVSVLTGGTSRQYNTTFGQDEHIEL